MVISALRVEIATTAGAEKSAQPDEVEIAAALAAIVAYTAATDNLSEESVAQSDCHETGWQKAAYREATGGTRVVAPQAYCKLSPWQAAGFFKVCLSLPIACLSLLLIASSALAQELRPLPADQMDADSTQSVTTYTPPVRTTSTKSAITRRMTYSKVAPAQGYPFVNGRSAGQTTLTIPAAVAPPLPFNGQQTAPASRTSAVSNAATNNDGWIEDPPDDGTTPLAPSSASMPYAPTSGLPSSGAYFRQVPAMPVASAQNSSQLNPAFIGKKTIIKIALSFGNSRIDLASIDGAQIRDAASGAAVANLTPSSRWDLALVSSGRYSSQLTLAAKHQADSQLATSTAYSDSSKYKNVAFYPSTAAVRNAALRLPLKMLGADSVPGDITASSSGYIIAPRSDDPNAVIAFNGKLYRGSIWLRPLATSVGGGQYKATAFDVINLVDVEDYLLSVVPSEMPSGWPLEALKAQAVAARSYAVANMGKHAKDGYDLRATIDDQVYSGIASESDYSNQAVAETNGLVLKHQGKAITAFFHSTSGGSTEVSEKVWGKSLPYLQCVPDFDDASPHFSWTKRVAVDDLERMLGPDVGRLLSLSVVTRSGSNRAQYLMAQGSNGTKVITGEMLRKSLKLPSTLFNVGCDSNNYIFAGRGYGHGLGMSQYGAKALAERGCNAAQILSYYYKDVVVDNAAPTPGI